MRAFWNDLRYARFNSPVARKVLGLFYRTGRAYLVPFGPLRGMKVRYHPGMNYHALLGLWERESAEVVGRVIRTIRESRPGRPLVIADVGANLGMYVLYFARLLGDGGHVYAFEPAPGVVETLRQNVALNRIGTVTVVPQAVSDRTGSVTFYVGWHHHTSSLDGRWAAGTTGEAKPVEVPATTLDSYFGEAGAPLPAFIKMDIEGGAVFALKGCAAVAESARPTVYIESHTPDEDRAIADFIADHRYAAYRLSNRAWVRNPTMTHPDPDGVWGNLFLFPAEQQGRFSALLPAPGTRPNT